MKDFDIEKLERKNIYTVPDDLFENLQDRVLSGVSDFDLEKLERKNIYAVSEDMYENVQNHVINTVFPRKKAPVFKLNWAYAIAASIALIFGTTFIFNSDDEPTNKNDDSNASYVATSQEPKAESEIAYETLKSDLTSVENNNQKVAKQSDTKVSAPVKAENEQKTVTPTVKSTKQSAIQMSEYLDSFSNSEISELASNSTQDVYLDLYN